MPGTNPSAILLTAGLAVAILLSVVGWQLGTYRAEHAASDSIRYERPADERPLPTISPTDNDWRDELMKLGLVNTAATSSSTAGTFSDTVAEEFLNGYFSLKESGSFTNENAAKVGSFLAENLRVPIGFTLHGENELTLSAETSKERVLQYRSDMREALSVLINGSPPEFEIFALYVETKNPQRLLELETSAKRYREAEKKTLAVIVPKDAATLHIRVTNALGGYATAVEQLVRSIDSPVTTLGVLRTYNEAEREMLYAFDALASYYVQKSSE